MEILAIVIAVYMLRDLVGLRDSALCVSKSDAIHLREMDEDAIVRSKRTDRKCSELTRAHNLLEQRTEVASLQRNKMNEN